MSADHELKQDFQTEVLDRSHERAVLVDFWAEWCGPCRTLGPVLEALAATAQGRWELVKVDTERHPELSSQFGIRSIPAVKLFHAGKAVAEFVGALPEPQITAWLQEHLPGPGDDLFAQSRQALASGDMETARARLEQTLEADPKHSAARLELAQMQMRGDTAGARATLSALPPDGPEADMAENLHHLLHVVEWAQGSGPSLAEEAQSDPAVLNRYREAAVALANGELETALEAWIEVLSVDRGLDDDGARRACIALFAMLGEEQELTRTWRRRFSMALA